MSGAVLVCGGTGAIGNTIVSTLTERGYRVAFSGRDQSRAAALEDATGAVYIAHDARDNGANVVHAARHAIGTLSGLVLNAGAIIHSCLATTPSKQLRELLHVNVTVPISQAQTAALEMTPGSAIVAVASNAGLWGESEIGAYSVSKAALLAACRALAAAYGPRGIRVNAICPGDTEPGMAASLAHLGGDVFTSVPPLGRRGKPYDTAAAVAYLLSADADFATGTALLLDGGMHAAIDAGHAE